MSNSNEMSNAMSNANEKDVSNADLCKIVDNINEDLNTLIAAADDRNRIITGLVALTGLVDTEKLCQSCTNNAKECVCYPVNEYCEECGDKCEGIHSLKRSKAAEEQAEELSRVVLSYGVEITQKVIEKLNNAINK